MMAEMEDGLVGEIVDDLVENTLMMLSIKEETEALYGLIGEEEQEHKKKQEQEGEEEQTPNAPLQRAGSVMNIVAEIETRIHKQSNWQKYETEEGIPFYYNKETDESLWENPEQEVDEVAEPMKTEHEEDNEVDADYEEALNLISRLHKAVEQDRSKQVQTLINAGIDVNALDIYGFSPLFYASSVYMFDLLISLGANVSVRASSIYDGGLCHYYASSGDTVLMEKVLEMYTEQGQQVLAAEFPLLDGNGETPLHVAARECQLECVKLLINYQIFDAATRHALSLFEYGNNEGYSARDVCTDETICNFFDQRLFHEELTQWRRRALEVEPLQEELHIWKSRAQTSEAECQRLQEEVAYLKEQLEEYENHYALQQEQTHAYHHHNSNYDVNESEVFLEEPATGDSWEKHETEDGTPFFYNPLTGDSQYETPYDFESADENMYQFVEEEEAHQVDELKHFQHQPDPEKVGKVWMKFFERAAKASLGAANHRNREATGEIANTKWSTDPNSMLGTAIDMIDPEGVLKALESGASPLDDLSDSSEADSMLHRCASLAWDENKAVQRKIVRIAGSLIDHGADIDITDTKSVSPLHIAASNGNHSLVQLLLQNAANVNVVDMNGDTPLHLAASGTTKGHLKSVQLLIRYGADIHCLNRQGNTASDSARLQMVLSEEPPKALCQIAEMLVELSKVAGNESNPFAKPDDNDGEDTPKNRYRLVRNPSHREWPAPPGFDSRDESDEVEDGDTNDGWFSNILNKILPTTPTGGSGLSSPSSNFAPSPRSKPPTDQELQKMNQLNA